MPCRAWQFCHTPCVLAVLYMQFTHCALHTFSLSLSATRLHLALPALSLPFSLSLREVTYSP